MLLSFATMISRGQGDGLPRGANLPYLRYEGEVAALSGGAHVVGETGAFDAGETSVEASDQRYVVLRDNGSAVCWRVREEAEGLTLRFTIPDNIKTGEGLKGSLSLYVNGHKRQELPLTSYWAYQYFIAGNSDPFQTPKEKTFMRFDEVHVRLGESLKEGDTLSLRKENGDTLSYGIDFVELEPAGRPEAKPAGYLSVSDYGAAGDDEKDDLAAFNACIKDAAARRMNVYIPPGRFILSDKLLLNVSGMKIMGAGIWHTYLYFSTNRQFYGGVYARASRVEISGFSMNTANNARYKYDETNARVQPSPYKMYKGFMGTYGDASYIHDVWVEHFECGFWIAGYDAPFPVDITQRLHIANCRIRNNYADGVNFCRGTSHSLVSNCSFRNNGDDAMAVWPVGGDGVNQPCINDTFANNTVENNWRAGSAGIFGGYGHVIHHCLIKDGVGGSGIRFTNDFPGYTFDSLHAYTRVFDNTIIRCGSVGEIWDLKKGAVEIYAGTGIYNLAFDDNDIDGSQLDAVQLFGKNLYHVVFNHTRIDGCRYGINCLATSHAAVFNGLKISNATAGNIYQKEAGFLLQIVP